MKALIPILFSIVSVVSSAEGKLDSLLSCHEYRGVAEDEMFKSTSSFQLATHSNGKSFVYSPSNFFIQESEEAGSGHFAAYLRQIDVERNPNRLLREGLEVFIVTPNSERLSSYQNLPRYFEENYTEIKDITVIKKRGVSLRSGIFYDDTYPFSNVLIARSIGAPYQEVLMSKDGSKYFTTHYCRVLK